MCIYKKCPPGKEKCTCSTDIAFFLVRIALAAVFIVHGWSKFADLEASTGYFIALKLPSVLTYVVASVELLGGIAMLLGIGTTAAGVGIAIVMVGAITKAKWSQGFYGGWEFDLVLLLCALAVAAAGPGSISVYHVFNGKEPIPRKTRSAKPKTEQPSVPPSE
ncbi:MAG: DoxX family protein [Candidatus Jacksonbacteria bacterium]|nr:DoxX family protein [Candidatus Jacksonbacteria bacterium]